MAEDFQHINWWNNSRSSAYDGGSQSIASPSSSSLSCSTTTTDVGGVAFSWSSASEISESKPVRLCDSQIDSSHIPGLGFSSTDWNQTLPERAEINFHSMLQDHSISTKPFSGQELGESSSTIPFKDINSGASAPPPPYMYSSSSMLQGLIEQDSRFPQPFLDSQHMVDYQSQMMAYHGVSNEMQQPSWNKPPQLFDGFSQKQQSAINHLQFSNNYPSFWNASSGFYPSLPPSRTQLFESKSSCSVPAKGLGGDSESRTTREPSLKKTRIETHSAMPAFKVRKEKLGDRITALQQLVSPFGKTDTASVLHEAIEYIKFLHDQVSVLCTPYFKTGRSMQQKQSSDKCLKSKEEEGSGEDVLRSRGLCLVPIASIYPVTNENSITSDFWTPIHGRTNCHC